MLKKMLKKRWTILTSSIIGNNLILVLTLTICFSNVIIAYETRGTTKNLTNTWKDISYDCVKEDTENLSMSCEGIKIIRKVIQEYLENSSKESDIEIFDGISLVEVNNSIDTRKGRYLKGFGTMTPFLQFLEGRELRVKLPKLLPNNFDDVFENTLAASTNGEGRRGGGGGNFGGGGGGFGGGKGGGGKKGGGGMMLLALMMGKMLATMGFGALGLLTLKALMVSGLALMLSVIIAVKKLTSGGDDGGGHHVVYAQETGGHHHRKKRSNSKSLGYMDDILETPYRGYADLYGDVKVS